MENAFKFYYGGNTNILNNPNMYNIDDWFYYGNINFIFDQQFSYNNYKASTIDGLVVISTLFMMNFIVWKVLCYGV